MRSLANTERLARGIIPNTNDMCEIGTAKSPVTIESNDNNAWQLIVVDLLETCHKKPTIKFLLSI